MAKLINILAFCIASGICFLAACNKSGLDQNPPVINPVNIPVGSSDITRSMNDFAFDFFKTVLNNDKTESNKLVSPLSIFITLSMIYNGSGNATRDSIAHALRLTSGDIQKLNDVCKILIEGLPTVDNKVKMSMVNSIWYNTNGPQPVPDFLTTINQSYHAAVKPVDFFNSETAINEINNWIADNTNQKIKNILDNIDSGDLMFLINAIYFKGPWKNKFEVSKTINEDFHTSGGNLVSTPFMVQENTIHYAHSNNLQVAELPYSAGEYNVYIVLPDENTHLTETMASINATTFHELLSDTQSVKLSIHLPKWKSSYKINSLRPGLAAMGMDIAFTDQADFTKMYTHPVQVTKAIHQTFIEVTEEGTEAAAATVIGVGTTASTSPPVLKINRPFIYVIAEKSSGTILFTGVINNPGQP